ncbi:MAG: tail fiber protein, partial [Clostridia bacterium]|nr:tail fiber protein [Clostridia bacterium]
VVYFNDYSISGPILDNILENIAMSWGGEIRMYEAVYSQLDFIRGLGINVYGLPLFAVFENGVLVGQRGMAVEENQISVWLDTFRAAHIYRAFPRTVFGSVGDGSRSTYFISELILMPERTGLAGFIRCRDNTILSVEEHSPLYALMENTFGGSGRTSFGLPNLDARIPAPGLRYFICRDGRFPLRDDDWKLNEVVSGDIKYLEFPMEDLNSNSFIGEVVLVKGEPDEWYVQLMVPCDGRMLSMRDEPILGSLLGNRFGGDGNSAFAVPDLSHVTAPVPGAQYYIMREMIYPSE